MRGAHVAERIPELEPAERRADRDLPDVHRARPSLDLGVERGEALERLLALAVEPRRVVELLGSRRRLVEHGDACLEDAVG